MLKRMIIINQKAGDLSEDRVLGYLETGAQILKYFP